MRYSPLDLGLKVDL